MQIAEALRLLRIRAGLTQIVAVAPGSSSGTAIRAFAIMTAGLSSTSADRRRTTWSLSGQPISSSHGRKRGRNFPSLDARASARSRMRLAARRKRDAAEEAIAEAPVPLRVERGAQRSRGRLHGVPRAIPDRLGGIPRRRRGRSRSWTPAALREARSLSSRSRW